MQVGALVDLARKLLKSFAAGDCPPKCHNIAFPEYDPPGQLLSIETPSA